MDYLKNYDSLDRSVEKDLTNQLIDRYFDHTESWLRAILRKCIFSLTFLHGETVFVIECPNVAVAKRLSRKTYPFLCFADHFSDSNNERILVCYLDENESWQCYDSSQKSWMSLSNFVCYSAPNDS
ncbi:hypothetical protein [Okeania sp.]|uniref:hypothetical protein n=1 Tax=Okeania sp. TaxID=3100323 RepID=UPI002B4AE7E5|nr:hypothetical protein [Okeania sp.]MEB3340295.1 hypothetical protein [Okeania sp.]